MADARPDPGPDPLAAGHDTLELRYTAAQRRRYRRGLLAVGAMVWSAGFVRFTLVGRLTRPSGWLALVVLAALLVVLALAVATIEPILRLDDEGLAWRWGPRHQRLAWSQVGQVELVEQGTARRVVLQPVDPTGRRRRRLPVPLTGGSLLGPGVDGDLDGKVDLIRGRWAAAGPPWPDGSGSSGRRSQ